MSDREDRLRSLLDRVRAGQTLPVGGIDRDLAALIRRLKTMDRDETDDGMVRDEA